MALALANEKGRMIWMGQYLLLWRKWRIQSKIAASSYLLSVDVWVLFWCLKIKDFADDAMCRWKWNVPNLQRGAGWTQEFSWCFAVEVRLQPMPCWCWNLWWPRRGWCMVGCPSVNGNARRIGRIEDVESVCFEFLRLDPFMPTSAWAELESHFLRLWRWLE